MIKSFLVCISGIRLASNRNSPEDKPHKRALCLAFRRECLSNSLSLSEYRKTTKLWLCSHFAGACAILGSDLH